MTFFSGKINFTAVTEQKIHKATNPIRGLSFCAVQRYGYLVYYDPKANQAVQKQTNLILINRLMLQPLNGQLSCTAIKGFGLP